MNLNELISVCISPGIEFRKSLIEILLHSNTAESLAAPRATAAEEGESLVTHTVDSLKSSLYCRWWRPGQSLIDHVSLININPSADQYIF